MNSLKVKEHEYGTELQSDSIIAVFGNKSLTHEMAMDLYSLKELRFLKQTHSDLIVESKKNSIIEADAHFTKEKNIALGIYTADCIPALIWDSDASIIAACHAGWRGVQNRIIEKSILSLLQLNCQSQNLNVAIGPHIKTESFEVDLDVAKQLVESSYTDKKNIISEHKNNKKLYIDLAQIALSQIIYNQVNKNNIWISQINTVTNTNYHSFRRDKVAKRLVSFIVHK